MPTLNIQGRSVNVDPSFLNLSPDEQNSTVDEIAKSLPKATPPSSPLAAITDVPAEVKSATSSAWDALKGMWPDTLGGTRDMGKEGALEGIGNTGKLVLNAAGLPTAPVVGAARSLLGHPLADATMAIGSKIDPDARVDPTEIYDASKAGVDTALNAMAPGRGGLSTLRGPAPVPPPPATGPLGVTLSAGQEAGSLPLIQTEQAALRGQMGPKAQTIAEDFKTQQAGQLDAATKNVAQGLDPLGQIVADSPQQAGSLVSQSVQDAANQAKSGVKNAYDYAQSLPGEIHADVFRDMGTTIRNDLSSGVNPIVIDDKLTPFAARAIKDIDSRVSVPFIQNMANPAGHPNPSTISGINLKGVDQMRRRLSAFRNDAFASGNAADGRAAASVLDAFDDRVATAINGGAFTGDPRAIQAWNDARAANADYRKTFSAGKNDPIGRVVEKVLGKGANPAAIPNDVADFIYGSSGVNPSGLNVGVANRFKGILGQQSPEWSAVKQGLFSRLVEPGPGMTEFGPGKIAQRVNRFLNADGKDLANAMFSPTEKQMLQSYADLHRKLEIPQSGANWSNTATFMTKTLNKVSGALGVVIGSALGHAIGLPWGAAEVAGFGAARTAAAASNKIQAQKIAKQMPNITIAMQRWQKTVAAANALPSSPAVRFVTLNLARSLSKIGVDLPALQAPGMGHADQQNAPSVQGPFQ